MSNGRNVWKRIKWLLCRHKRDKATTVGGYLRCYDCGRDYLEAEKRWVDHIYMLGFLRLTGQDGFHEYMRDQTAPGGNKRSLPKEAQSGK